MCGLHAVILCESTYHHVSKNRPVLGEEMLQAMGFPKSLRFTSEDRRIHIGGKALCVRGFDTVKTLYVTENQKKALAGNTFPVQLSSALWLTIEASVLDREAVLPEEFLQALRGAMGQDTEQVVNLTVSRRSYASPFDILPGFNPRHLPAKRRPAPAAHDGPKPKRGRRVSVLHPLAKPKFRLRGKTSIRLSVSK